MSTNKKEESSSNEKGKEVAEGKYDVYLDQLSVITDNLETYQGRDTVITLFHYLALIAADFCSFFSLGVKHNMSDNFVNMFVQLSNCRVMLRLLDDWSAVREYYRFHEAQKIKKTVSTYVRYVTIFNLLSWVLYNPCEHIGWLGELNIIKASDQMWYFWTNVWWATGLFTSVMLNARVCYIYYNQQNTKAKREDDPNHDSSEIISHSDYKNAKMVAIRDFLDWCIAIHFMPEGFLWSAQLYHYQVGIIGTVSSLIRAQTYVINRQ